MSPPRVSSGTTRVAVLGAASPSGSLVREALAEHGVAGSRVDLYGVTHGEVLLSEYAGEARLVQEPAPGDVAEHGFIFLCEGGEAASATIQRAGAGCVVLDLVACCGSQETVPLVHPDINPEAARHHTGLVRVPHPVAMVLAEILLPVERTLGVHQASAVVLRPASDFGERGVEELRDQTVGLLRFSEPPREVFGGRQLAFNLIPHKLLGATGEPDLERRLAAEVARMLSWPESRLTVALVAAPIFHGHALAIRVEPERTAGSSREMLDTFSTERQAKATPMEAAGKRAVTVAEIREDGLGGFWLWAVAGEAGPASAVRAVRLAGMLGEL
jgi:aspartate-semialdehyde dehydrogenase